MTYQEAKKWFEIHQQKFVLALCFVLVFLAGIGVGKYEKANRQSNKNQSNYSTNFVNQQTKNTQNPEAGETAVLGVQTGTKTTEAVKSTSTQAAGECKVKGNISSGGSKIYHVLGGAFYKTVKPEMCFNTEAEALAAGFRKSGR